MVKLCLQIEVADLLDGAGGKKTYDRGLGGNKSALCNSESELIQEPLSTS